MLRSNSKRLGNHVVSPEEEKEIRLHWQGFAEKEARGACIQCAQYLSLTSAETEGWE